jgi:hypothetical protein
MAGASFIIPAGAVCAREEVVSKLMDVNAAIDSVATTARRRETGFVCAADFSTDFCDDITSPRLTIVNWTDLF